MRDCVFVADDWGVGGGMFMMVCFVVDVCVEFLGQWERGRRGLSRAEGDRDDLFVDNFLWDGDCNCAPAEKSENQCKSTRCVGHCRLWTLPLREVANGTRNESGE